MNVTMEKVDNVNGIITVSLAENDYQDKVKKELKLIGQRYPEKGFRPGHVPTALLQKKYGKENRLLFKHSKKVSLTARFTML